MTDLELPDFLNRSKWRAQMARTAKIGHNIKSNGSAANGQLRQFIERIERLDDEKRQLSTDIASVYAEAKASGFDVKTMRKIVAMRRLSDNDREEQQAMVDTYMNALGMLRDTPLGQAAMERDGVTA